ncbi:MAG: glucose 1-dehydrogenase [Peptococcaceae bacterium]|jgi:3-oxoacyl-[acyl-carrier protein] reductase|nr:glucose 1-dehydrogenase [Peptococcaceae bacterium]
MQLAGKVAIVTGAREGIGAGVAVALAEAGADLVLVSRAINEDDAPVRAARAAGRRVLVKQVDVASAAQVEDMVAGTMAEFGRVDVLFNNAGLSVPGMLWKMSEEAFDRVIAVNLKGTFLCTKAVAGPMMAQKSGSIINVTSSAGLLGTIGQVNYTAAKGGVHAFTKSAAKELARYGVRVNAVAPMAETRMTETIAHDPRFKEKYLERIPLGRFGQPEEVGPAVVFLAGDGSRYITGQTLCVDGGMVML